MAHGGRNLKMSAEKSRKSPKKEPKLVVKKKTINLPPFVVESLFDLWKGTPESEWIAGFDFEPELDEPQRIVLRHGMPNRVEVEDEKGKPIILEYVGTYTAPALEEDYELTVHTHPKARKGVGKILSSYFSPQDFIAALKHIHKFPLSKRRKHNINLLLNVRGQLIAMYIPRSAYEKYVKISEKEFGIKNVLTHGMARWFKIRMEEYANEKACKDLGIKWSPALDWTEKERIKFDMPQRTKTKIPKSKKRAYAKKLMDYHYEYAEKTLGIKVKKLDPPYEIPIEMIVEKKKPIPVLKLVPTEKKLSEEELKGAKVYTER
jgi:hypothetical protein